MEEVKEKNGKYSFGTVGLGNKDKDFWEGVKE